MKAQRGAFAIAFALMVVLILGVIGLALDSALMFNRATEMQALADAGALAAARKLDGSTAGVNAAVAAAQSLVAANTYGFGRSPGWNEAALRFASTPDGSAAWVDAAAARGAPSGLLYARLDATELSADDGRPLGRVDLGFSRLFASAAASTDIGGVAIAGRSQIAVLPLGVCALAPEPAKPRPPANQELLEFGFRRGVGYNLLNLNPNGNAPANYLLNPLDGGAAANHPNHFAAATVTPYLCSGSMALRSLAAGVHVRAPFPSGLASALNSRFDDFSGSGCNPVSAPPDRNIREFNGAYAGWYMNAISGQSAAASTGSNLLTIADLADPGSVSAAAYGPLWAATRAARYAAAPPYTNFSKTDWATLYPATPSAPAANSFLHTSNSPYQMQVLAPSRPGQRNRRMLHVALLACPLSGSVAEVLGVGKFFLTAKAGAAGIHGEFAGALSADSLTSRVELFQ